MGAGRKSAVDCSDRGEVMLNRVVTGAHYGLRDWLAQRVTAVVMACFVLFVVGYLLLQPRVDYDVWTRLFSNNVTRSFALLFLLSLFYHAWIGVRDIVMDYVKPASIRLLVHVAVILALLMYTIWSVQILWGY
jgi:succinate dehydrogenase / fumarate reductase membrane anchor subunit